MWVEIIFSNWVRPTAKSWSLLQNISEHSIHFLPGFLSVVEQTRPSEYPSQVNIVWWNEVKNNLCSSDFPSKSLSTFRRPRATQCVDSSSSTDSLASSHSIQFHSANIFWAFKFFRTGGNLKKKNCLSLNELVFKNNIGKGISFLLHQR